jgi:hypothetical protein
LEKPVQIAFHQLERFFALQHEGLHSVPTQLEHIAMPEKMAKIQISIQPYNQGRRNGRRPCSSRLSHQIQKFTVPRLALGRSVVTFCGNALKDVFNAVVEGVTQGGKRGNLVIVGRVRRALLEKRAIMLQQAL